MNQGEYFAEDFDEEVSSEPTSMPSTMAPARGSESDLVARVETLESEVRLLGERLAYALRAGRGPKPVIACPETLEIAADCQLEATDGFYGVEFAPDGRAYRWTGPSPTFGVDVVLDRRSQRRFVLRLAGASHPDGLAGLRAFADAEELELCQEPEPPPGLIEFGAVLPATGDSGPLRLWVFVPKVMSPCELDPSSLDERRLGVAFVSMSVD
jgi:hypothetical protein